MSGEWLIIINKACKLASERREKCANNHDHLINHFSSIAYFKTFSNLKKASDEKEKQPKWVVCVLKISLYPIIIEMLLECEWCRTKGNTVSKGEQREWREIP